MYLHSHFHDEREFHYCFSSCFHDYVYRNFKILISIKRRTFSINHYIHKTYLHSNNEKQQQQKYFEKFIEELDFIEQSTQVKYLRCAYYTTD